jgi:2-keto-4-pentenoate hydratase
VGYHRPVFGFLLASGEHATGSRFRVADLIAPLVETELCLTVDRTLRGPGITPAQARQAVCAAAPAFELVERRGDFAADPPLSMADNVQQKGFITGAALHPLPAALALRTVTVEVFLNGQAVERASGREVFGDPAASVAWLANALAPFGLAVEPGMRIMSGSFTRQYPARPGDRIEARFDPIGTVAALFE